MADLFAGASRYTNDFSAVIDRSVRIWSLSLTQMQQVRTRTDDERIAIKSIDSRISGLQSTLQALEDSVKFNAYQTTSSASDIVKATAADGVAEGNYTLQVSKIGAYSTAVSTHGVADPSTGNYVTEGKLNLRLFAHDEFAEGSPDPTVSTDIDIDLTKGKTLQNIVDIINEKHFGLVQASIVNVSTTGTPSYALSLQSSKLGKTGIQVNEKKGDGTLSTELIKKGTTGATGNQAGIGHLAQYTVNGAALTSQTRSITIAPNLTADLVKADSTKEVTVKVTRSTNSFQAAAKNFIAAFNDIITGLDTSSGAKGELAGNSIVNSVRQTLRAAVTTTLSSGAVTSLAQAGIEFTKQGLLQLDQAKFDKVLEKHGFDALKAMIGTAKDGGVMKDIKDTLSSLRSVSASDIVSGMLTETLKGLDQAIKIEDDRINAEQLRIEQRTLDLQARLAAADATIAALEQQANYFNNMFEAMRANQNSYS